jgi:hypothetical protein
MCGIHFWLFSAGSRFIVVRVSAPYHHLCAFLPSSAFAPGAENQPDEKISIYFNALRWVNTLGAMATMCVPVWDNGICCTALAS